MLLGIAPCLVRRLLRVSRSLGLILLRVAVVPLSLARCRARLW